MNLVVLDVIVLKIIYLKSIIEHVDVSFIIIDNPKCSNETKICKPVCQTSEGASNCACMVGFKFIPQNFSCIQGYMYLISENLYDSSILSFFSPLNFSLGILGFSIMIILVTIVAIIFILHSKSLEEG